MAEFKDENGVCPVCHPKPFVWGDSTRYVTDLDDCAEGTSLRSKLWGDKLTIVADDACYYPKFCPECGRRLREMG